MSRGGLNFIRSQSKSLLDTVSRNPMYVLSVFVLSILFTAQIYGRDIWMGLILTCVASAIVSLILPPYLLIVSTYCGGTDEEP